MTRSSTTLCAGLADEWVRYLLLFPWVMFVTLTVGNQITYETGKKLARVLVRKRNDDLYGHHCKRHEGLIWCLASEDTAYRRGHYHLVLGGTRVNHLTAKQIHHGWEELVGGWVQASRICDQLDVCRYMAKHSVNGELDLDGPVGDYTTTKAPR